MLVCRGLSVCDDESQLYTPIVLRICNVALLRLCVTVNRYGDGLLTVAVTVYETARPLGDFVRVQRGTRGGAGPVRPRSTGGAARLAATRGERPPACPGAPAWDRNARSATRRRQKPP